LEYIGIKEYDKALKCFKSSLDYDEDPYLLNSRQSKDAAKVNMALLLKDLGIEFKNKNENEKAYEYLKEVLYLFNDLKNVFYDDYKH
jgi:tetratricopeptide (TPR) repeat protein